MLESTITAKGQTTVPRDIRAALGLKPGDKLRYLVLEDGQVRILKQRPATDLSGLLHRPGQKALTVEEMDAAIEAGRGDHDA
jgi:antitoxin PrlF